MRLGADALCAAIGGAVAPFGLNLVGVARPEVYDGLVPVRHRLGARTPAAAIVVVGNGGGALWTAFRAHLRDHPAAAARPHPLDDFTRAVLADAAAPLLARHGARGALRLPFDTDEPPLSFAHLAQAAGLGAPSLLGVVLHPEFGPWIALRGAFLLDVPARAARPAAGFDPCAACVERPCVAACPGAAVTVAAGWDAERCMAHRLSADADGRCDAGCHARVACVYGTGYRYPDEAAAYHQGRAREVMERVSRARAEARER
jgi:hypothetical protein